MRALIATLGSCLALLLAVDAGVPLVLRSESFENVAIRDQRDDFGGFFARQIREVAAAWGVGLSRRHRAWDALPALKSPDELRVFLFGNSIALFAIEPHALERRLAEEFPTRDVSVTSLAFAATGTPEAGFLVDAALRKQADVIVLTPSLSGLWESEGKRAPRLRERFDPDAAQGASPSEWLRGLARRHWALYRERFELRDFALGSLPAGFGGGSDRALAEAVEAISAAAGSGDVARLIDTYRQHAAMHLAEGAVLSRRIGPDSPAYAWVDRVGARVQGSAALGLAVFMPVNPVFRAARPVPGYEAYHLDPVYVRETARRVLERYAAAGLSAVDRTDALPAEAFFDPVHANSRGMRAFTRELAELLAQTIRHDRP
jgi:hypothetical protein